MTEIFDHPLRYLVCSRSRPEVKHLVQLDSYGGNGKCTCELFKFRFEPALLAGQEAGEKLRCQHILNARDQFCTKIIMAMIDTGANRE